MNARWRYGLAVDFTVTIWACSVCAIGLLCLSGVMRMGWGWPAVAVLAMGALGVVIDTMCAWITIKTIREGRGNGDVPGGGAR